MNQAVAIEAFICIILAVLGIYEGLMLSKKTLLFKDNIGPGGYIFFVSGLLFICSVLYLLKHIVHAGHEVIADRKRFSLHVGTAGRLWIILALYATATPLLGYFLGSIIFFVFALKIAGIRSWLKSFLTGLALSVAFQLFFCRLAGIIFL